MFSLKNDHFSKMQVDPAIICHEKDVQESSDRDDIKSIQELNEVNENMFNSIAEIAPIQPFVYISDSSDDEEEDDASNKDSPTTKYVKKMLAKQALLNDPSTASKSSVPAVAETRSIQPELESMSTVGWSPPRKKRPCNCPSPECPEVLTPEKHFLKRVSKDPIVLEEAEKLFFENLKLERSFWPKSLFHSSSDDDSEDADKCVANKSFQVASESHSGNQPNKCVEDEGDTTFTYMLPHTDKNPFDCTVCDQSFRHNILLQHHRKLYHNPKYVDTMAKEKMYKCPLCPRKFRHNYNLINHMDPPHVPASVMPEECGNKLLNEENEIINCHEDDKEFENENVDMINLSSSEDSDSM